MKTNTIHRIAISMAFVMSVVTMGFAQHNSHAQGRTQNSTSREITSSEQNTRNSRRQEANTSNNNNVASGQNNRYNDNSNRNETSNNKGQNNGNHYGQNKDQHYESNGNSNHYGKNNQVDHYTSGKSGYDDRGDGYHNKHDYTYEPQRNNDCHTHDNYRDNNADYGYYHKAPAYCHRLPGKSYHQYDFSGVRYYHSDGRFYKYSKYGYYVVDCPYIVVNMLPLHYSIRYFNGYRLAFHHGHFFIPVEHGWMMVPEPEAPQFSMNINIGF